MRVRLTRRVGVRGATVVVLAAVVGSVVRGVMRGVRARVGRLFDDGWRLDARRWRRTRRRGAYGR